MAGEGAATAIAPSPEIAAPAMTPVDSILIALASLLFGAPEGRSGRAPQERHPAGRDVDQLL